MFGKCLGMSWNVLKKTLTDVHSEHHSVSRFNLVFKKLHRDDPARSSDSRTCHDEGAVTDCQEWLAKNDLPGMTCKEWLAKIRQFTSHLTLQSGWGLLRPGLDPYAYSATHNHRDWHLRWAFTWCSWTFLFIYIAISHSKGHSMESHSNVIKRLSRHFFTIFISESRIPRAAILLSKPQSPEHFWLSLAR